MVTTCSKLFWTFLQQNQMVLAVIVAVLAVRFLIRKLPKKYSYLLWGIVGLRMMFMTWLPFRYSFFQFISLVQLRLFSGMGRTNQMSESSLDRLGTKLEQGWNGIHQGLEQTGNVGAMKEGVALQVSDLQELLSDQGGKLLLVQRMLLVLCIIWITGIVVMLSYGMISSIRCRRLVKQAVRLEGNVWECDNLPSPFVRGLVRPQIYLPFHLSEGEKRYILEHERCHIRRKDSLVKLVAFCLLAVYWINPLVWLSYYLMSQDLEMSCDEAVLKKLGNGIKKDYSSSLLAFAVGKRNIAGRWKELFAPLAFGESNSSRRIRHVLNYKKPKVWGSALGILVVVVIAVLCLTNQTERNPVEGENAFTKDQMPENQDTDRQYQLYPEVMNYMTMTYPEYQNLSGQEMEHDRNGFFIGSLPDSEIEITMQGRYSSERGIYIDERAKFVKLQGKLPELVSIPQEAYGELSWEELFTKLCRWEDTLVNWGENQTKEELLYDTSEMAIALPMDCDEDGESERILAILLQGRSLLDKIDPDVTIWLEWRGKWE